MVIAEALKLGGYHFLYETCPQENDQTEIHPDELEEETIPNEIIPLCRQAGSNGTVKGRKSAFMDSENE